ncbi:MAG: hypothetical protein PHF56_24375 [Desulfuromonadaceae bacterium]|nr:hypothetical protein [Desulfuromonadaceae bacterium]
MSDDIKSILSSRYVEAFTSDAQQALTKAFDTPIAFTIVSPLAEGADRLVANTVLDCGGQLEALLPMPREEYENDFHTSKSRQEFADLLDNAHRIACTDCDGTVNDADYRHNAYRHVGEETLERCDILIAIWDGKEAQSDCGTGAIVKLAREKSKPVFILTPANPGSVTLENEGVLPADFIAELNKFNAFRISRKQMTDYCNNEFSDLLKSTSDTPAKISAVEQIPVHLKQLVRERLIPNYCRASLIARKNQGRYFSTGKRAYFFSTISVAFMAGAIVFAKLPYLSLPGYMIELALLITLYVMIHRAVHGRVHHFWLEHRVLSERLRMAFYYVACGEVPLATEKGKTIHRRNRSWVELAYREILYRLPEIARPEEPPLQVYGTFIQQWWLAGQHSYHTKKAQTAALRNKLLKKLGMGCFGLAIVVSVIHHLFAIGAVAGCHVEGVTLLVEELLSIVAVTLPAAGAAVNGYRSLLEQSRIASRSAGMAHHLELIMNRPLPKDSTEFRHYLERIEELMLMESHDWLALMEHAELENIA